MNISLEWLKKYTEVPSDVAVVEEIFTRAGLSVEAVMTSGADFENVVVAQILEFERHPDADKLSVCRVDDGSGTLRQIVCGAKNFQVGDKVPLALPGAVLPGDLRIKVGKLRGVESEGMMCSPKELGLAADAAGLLILPSETVVGTPIAEVFPSDTVMELEITPNRGDWLSHIGVARELAAFTGKALRLPEVAPIEGRVTAEVGNDAAGDCLFYSALVIRGVKIAPSPAWLQRRIEAIGLRAINNVVDITNFVMHEMGQPLHAFDDAKVCGALRARYGLPGEKIVALDGKEYATEGHIVIADDSMSLALGGIMGGEGSGITEATTTLRLESAIFSPAKIRKSSRELGLASDSSYRYERGVDSQAALRVAARAARLIEEIAGGKAEAYIASSGDMPSGPAPVNLRFDRCRKILGVKISDEQICKALEGFGIEAVGEGTWKIPSYRLDLTREADLIEEVARAVGIEAIPSQVAGWSAARGDVDALYDFSAKLRDALAAQGFCEARMSALVASGHLAGATNAIRLKNPLGEDQAFMRPSLVPGLLDCIERNLRHGVADLRLFSIGKIFASGKVEETTMLALVVTGTIETKSWVNSEPREVSFHDLKGIVQQLAAVGMEIRPSKENAGVNRAEMTPCAEIIVRGKTIGLLGQLRPALARKLGATSPIFCAELSIEALQQAANGKRGFTPPPEFPSSARDIAFVVPQSLHYAAILKEIRAAKQALLTEVEAFDVYRDPTGKHLPVDAKSLAVRLVFRSTERTLKHEEVETATEAIRSVLRSRLGAVFRE